VSEKLFIASIDIFGLLSIHYCMKWESCLRNNTPMGREVGNLGTWKAGKPGILDMGTPAGAKARIMG
jgi:hypothetical protein